MKLWQVMSVIAVVVSGIFAIAVKAAIEVSRLSDTHVASDSVIQDPEEFQ